jgi:hypothetical protein
VRTGVSALRIAALLTGDAFPGRWLFGPFGAGQLRRVADVYPGTAAARVEAVWAGRCSLSRWADCAVWPLWGSLCLYRRRAHAAVQSEHGRSEAVLASQLRRSAGGWGLTADGWGLTAGAGGWRLAAGGCGLGAGAGGCAGWSRPLSRSAARRTPVMRSAKAATTCCAVVRAVGRSAGSTPRTNPPDGTA